MNLKGESPKNVDYEKSKTRIFKNVFIFSCPPCTWKITCPNTVCCHSPTWIFFGTSHLRPNEDPPMIWNEVLAVSPRSLIMFVQLLLTYAYVSVYIHAYTAYVVRMYVYIYTYIYTLVYIYVCVHREREMCMYACDINTIASYMHSHRIRHLMHL